MEKLEKYIELKETIETFLKKRNELKKRKDLYEPMKVSLLDYLCILNIVIYGEREIFPEELTSEYFGRALPHRQGQQLRDRKSVV